MAKAFRDTVCTSCGDAIKSGSSITLEDKDILCFRCHPESTTKHINIPAINSREMLDSNRPKRPFFLKRK